MNLQDYIQYTKQFKKNLAFKEYNFNRLYNTGEPNSIRSLSTARSFEASPELARPIGNKWTKHKRMPYW